MKSFIRSNINFVAFVKYIHEIFPTRMLYQHEKILLKSAPEQTYNFRFLMPGQNHGQKTGCMCPYYKPVLFLYRVYQKKVVQSP